MNAITNWISANYIELAGSALGIAYVLLATKQNIWCWLIGILSCGLYIAVFFSAQLYGDMTLQLFYLLIGIYGWYVWARKNDAKEQLKISSIKIKLFLWMLVAIIFMTLGFGYLLSFTNDPIPYTDGFTNALGLAGTWMTARKYIENWWLWIFANLFCVGVYYYKGLYPTVVFYFIMAILAWRAYLLWNKDFNKMQHA